MNYVEHHFGDYAKHTHGLSLLQHGAYRQLMDVYYVREKALPATLEACCVLVNARTPQEKKAVSAVLGLYFKHSDDGYRHSRCDKEISKYHAGKPDRDQRKANEQTRLARHREERCRLFAILNAAGAHASWNIPMNELRKLVAATAPATPTETPPATATATPATATHPPLPSSNTKEKKKNRRNKTCSAFQVPVPAWMPVDDWHAFLQHRIEISKPLSEEGQKRAIAKLDGYRQQGVSPSTVLNDAIIGGYQGLFAPKHVNGSSGATQAEIAELQRRITEEESHAH